MGEIKKKREEDVRDAQERLELDRIIEAVKTLPSHNTKYTPLSKVRISNFIAELDMLGLIGAKKVYRGRYGRIRLVSPNVPREKVLPILAEE